MLSLVTTTAVLGGGVVLPLAVALIFTLPVIGLNAFALMKLWNWFLVPGFDLPSLTFAAAIGSVLILKLLSDKVFRQETDKDPENKWANIFTAFLRPTFAVLTGWVALQLF